MQSSTKYTLEFVEIEFLKRGFVLMEDEYINNSTPMKYYCLKHPGIIRNKRLKDLLRGSGCPECNKKAKPRINDISIMFDSRSYVLLSKDYINNTSPLEYKCLKHPDEIRKITWNDFQQGAGCFECGLEKVKESKLGKNNPNWNGGNSELNSWLRSCVDIWRRNNKSKLNICFVTGEESGDLEIHHSFSFHRIRDFTFDKLQLSKREKISDYTTEEIVKIRETFLNLHDKVCAVALNSEIHKLFHKIYGRDVRYSQLREFKERYLKGDFNNGLEIV